MLQVPKKGCVDFCWYPYCIMVNVTLQAIYRSIPMVTQVSRPYQHQGEARSCSTRRSMRQEALCGYWKCYRCQVRLKSGLLKRYFDRVFARQVSLVCKTSSRSRSGDDRRWLSGNQCNQFCRESHHGMTHAI